MYQVIFSPAALRHMETIAHDLENKQTGLGNKFLEYTFKRIEVLYTYPSLPVIFNQIRVLQLRKYNYRLHFIIDNKRIKVLAIIHSKSNPENWRP
jgi:plasmid stabilization system protein ParE